MSLEEMAEKYSKKWNVPPEEAKEIIQKRLDKKPEKALDRTKVTPKEGLEFPEPLSEAAKKIMGINQAVLSTALTTKSLRELNLPPKELETLKQKIDYMETNLGQVVDLVNTTMSAMNEDLKARKAEEERKKLIDEMSEIIKPLKEKVEALEKLKPGEPGTAEALGALTTEKILAAGQEATEKAQKMLKKMGYEVKLPKGLTLEQVEAKINETMKVKKKEWEEKTGAEVEIEKERIRATETVLTGVVDRVFGIFLEPLKDEIHKAIKKGAFRRGP